MDKDTNTAILERLEKIVDTLSENSIKIGQLLAVNNEKYVTDVTEYNKNDKNPNSKWSGHE